MERMWWSFCLVLVYAQRNTSKGSNIVLIQVILALKYFSAFVFSEGHISAIVSQFRLSSLALMLCSDIFCLLLYYKMISIQDEPKYLQSFYCFTSMNTRDFSVQHKERTFLQAKPYKDHPTIAR